MRSFLNETAALASLLLVPVSAAPKRHAHGLVELKGSNFTYSHSYTSKINHLYEIWNTLLSSNQNSPVDACGFLLKILENNHRRFLIKAGEDSERYLGNFTGLAEIHTTFSHILAQEKNNVLKANLSDEENELFQCFCFIFDEMAKMRFTSEAQDAKENVRRAISTEIFLRFLSEMNKRFPNEEEMVGMAGLVEEVSKSLKKISTAIKEGAVMNVDLEGTCQELLKQLEEIDRLYFGLIKSEFMRLNENVAIDDSLAMAYFTMTLSCKLYSAVASAYLGINKRVKSYSIDERGATMLIFNLILQSISPEATLKEYVEDRKIVDIKKSESFISRIFLSPRKEELSKRKVEAEKIDIGNLLADTHTVLFQKKYGEMKNFTEKQQEFIRNVHRIVLQLFDIKNEIDNGKNRTPAAEFFMFIEECREKEIRYPAGITAYKNQEILEKFINSLGGNKQFFSDSRVKAVGIGTFLLFFINATLIFCFYLRKSKNNREAK